MWPGLWEIQKGISELKIAFCGVKPQAQKTYSSSSNSAFGLSPHSGLFISSIPIFFGFPTWTGVPCAQWNDLQILIT